MELLLNGFELFFSPLPQVSNYTKELEEMKHVTKQEFIASLRRYCIWPPSASVVSPVGFYVE